MESTILKKFIFWNKKLSNQLSNRYPRTFSGDVSTEKFQELIISYLKDKNCPKILECGGADRPFLARSSEYKLHGIDLDTATNCYASYDKYFCSSVDETFCEDQYDIIYSITLLEHVADNKKSILHISEALRDGGKQLHYVPNKSHLYSILLRLIGHKLQNRLIDLLRPEAKTVSGYKTYFDLCSPQQMTNEFEKHYGQTVTVYCFYRANEYFNFFVPLFFAVSIFENICRKYNLKSFCSGFIIEVSK